MEIQDLDGLRSAEELTSYQKEVRSRLTAINTEFAGLPLPEEARDEFANLTSVNEEIDTRVAELRARENVVAKFASSEAHTERPFAIHAAPTREVDIYDLSTIRANWSNPAGAKTELRDRAMRAVELMQFPLSESRAKGQDQLATLLDTVDDARGTIASLVLTTAGPTYRRAFGKTLAGNELSNEERAALSTGTTTAGGFAVPAQLDPTVMLTSAGAVNPMRAVARVVQTTSNTWQGITSAGITAGYAAEASEAGDDGPAIAQPEITPERADVFVPYSIEIGQDWNGLVTEVSRMIADAKDTLEADKFINGAGSGSTEPEGVIAGLATTSELNTTTIDTFASGDLYRLEAALPPRFRPRASFLAARVQYNKARQFDTGGGSELWVRIGAGLPPELLGYPAYEASEMDDTSTYAGGEHIVAFGDFQAGYVIVDRVGMSIEIIPHLFATGANRPSGQRGLFAFWRNSAGIVVDNAIRVLRVKAS